VAARPPDFMGLASLLGQPLARRSLPAFSSEARAN
jgi:hypothetical protein